MAKAICEMIDLLGKESNLNKVVLSGGVCTKYNFVGFNLQRIRR